MNSDHDVVYRPSNLAMIRHLSGPSRTMRWMSYGYYWTTKLACLNRKRYLLRYPHIHEHICKSVTSNGAEIFKDLLVPSCGIVSQCIFVQLIIAVNFFASRHFLSNKFMFYWLFHTPSNSYGMLWNIVRVRVSALVNLVHW